MNKEITIIDYGMGNVGSLSNMVSKVGGSPLISGDPAVISRAEQLILPGVGHFDNAMIRLTELGIVDALNQRVLEARVPILCICLGAQLVTRRSEEGVLPGLGWIAADTIRFRLEGSRLRIPHMGWNDVSLCKDSVLFQGMYSEPAFYFVHSYHLQLDDPGDALTTTVYGYEFVSALEKGNIFATQYHPEKSHKYGMLLMRNFVNLESSYA